MSFRRSSSVIFSSSSFRIGLPSHSNFSKSVGLRMRFECGATAENAIIRACSHPFRCLASSCSVYCFNTSSSSSGVSASKSARRSPTLPRAIPSRVSMLTLFFCPTSAPGQPRTTSFATQQNRPDPCCPPCP